MYRCALLIATWAAAASKRLVVGTLEKLTARRDEMQIKNLLLSLFGCAICLFLGFTLGNLIGNSKAALVFVAVLLALGVLVYLYNFEKEQWVTKFLEFIFLEVMVAGFLWEAWFSRQ
jgi:uncharacterized membrane protein YfcA